MGVPFLNLRFSLISSGFDASCGLWWYFFIEIFDSFREFFLGTFWLQLAAYVGGLDLRVRRQPLFFNHQSSGSFHYIQTLP